METANWAPEHSDALRDCVAKGMPFSEIATAINAKFNTAYTRNAALGRAKRMGLVVPERQTSPSTAKKQLARLLEIRVVQSRPLEFDPPVPKFEAAEPVKLRCVEIEPHHLSLLELERGDCRYPYGGDSDGELITFCGHPRQPGSSYCTPHFQLSRNPDLPPDPAVSIAPLDPAETT